MRTVGLILTITPVALLLYSYVLYPIVLRLLAAVRPERRTRSDDPAEWPFISITVPVFNEERQVESLLESLLALDYPADRRQILIVSDASTDGTDEIVRSYARRGIDFLRMPERSGKTAAENAVGGLLKGSIVVNTDASIRIFPDALKPLIRVFSDPGVGAASGRDISVSHQQNCSNSGEARYVGYEMAVRELETRVHGLVGASGCFYAIRADLHRMPLPGSLSRDFASALITRMQGYRTVSVKEARCAVPRTSSLEREYSRKVRTLTRGIETLAHMKHMLNPFRYGVFAWMLFSHKVCRWLVPWGIPLFAIGVAMLATARPALWILFGASTLGLAASGILWRVALRRRLPDSLALPAFVLAGNFAAMHASVRALLGDRDPIWEPTRRETNQAKVAAALGNRI